MINNQLLDYIKQQLTSGATKETITANLKGQGWIDADIAEAFSAAAIVETKSATETVVPSQPAGTARYVKWILIALVGVGVIFGGYFGYRKYTLYKETQKQELAKQAEIQKYQAIVEKIVKGDIQNLTKDDYLLYLNRPADYSAWLPKDSDAQVQVGAFHLNLDDSSRDKIVILGPQILFGEGYILLDSVETKNGPEDLSENGFEDQDKDIFHNIEDYEKVETSLGTYWKGDRDLHIDSEIADVVKISGKIVLPFYESVEKITITKTDTETLIASGKLSDITFNQNEFSVSYSGASGLVSFDAKDADGKSLEYSMKTSSGGDVMRSIRGEFDGEIASVDLVFGVPSKDIEIPFAIEKPKENVVAPVADVVNTAASTPNSATEGEKKTDAVVWNAVTDKAEIAVLQQAVGTFTNLFKVGDMAAIDVYMKKAGISYVDDFDTKSEKEKKEEATLLSKTLFSVTQKNLAAMKDIRYETARQKDEDRWAVRGVSAKDPIFESPIKETFYLKKIDGMLYVVDFELE